MSLAPARPGMALTEREVFVLQRLAEGDEYLEIAVRMGRSINTAKSHGHHAKVKLGARTAAHAVALGIARGWVTLPQGWYKSRMPDNTP